MHINYESNRILLSDVKLVSYLVLDINAKHGINSYFSIPMIYPYAVGGKPLLKRSCLLY